MFYFCDCKDHIYSRSEDFVKHPFSICYVTSVIAFNLRETLRFFLASFEVKCCHLPVACAHCCPE